MRKQYFKIIIFNAILLVVGCSYAINQHFYNNVISLEEALLAESNKTRKEYDLPLLTMDKKLRKIAYDYSKYMAETNFFAHTDPKNRNLSKRLSYSGVKFLLAAENLALITKGGFNTEEIVEAWLDSKYHRQNLLDQKFHLTGIGVFINNKGHYYITHILVQNP